MQQALGCGRCLADTELSLVASYCGGMPTTDIRGAVTQLESDVVAAACEGGWQLPCLSLGSHSSD